MCWEENFNKKFSITSHLDDDFRIIIGQRAYKQKLNDIPLRVDVDVDSTLQNIYFETNIKTIWNFKQVAFLVNDFVKIQDSLEMIFNILSGSSMKSLKILSYLRTRSKVITPQRFAKYLFEQHNLILINCYKYDSSNESDSPINNDLSNFIKSLDISRQLNYKILFIGKNKCAEILPNNYKIGYILHSSGVNLNGTRNVKYYNTWYCLDDNLINRISNVVEKPSFSDFKVL